MNQVEDLLLDIERLTKRNEILERDYKIVSEELEIARNIDFSSKAADDYESALSRMSDELQTSRKQSIMLAQKFVLVNAHLQLQKSALAEMRTQLDSLAAHYEHDITRALRVITTHLKEEAVNNADKLSKISAEADSYRNLAGRLTRELHDKEDECAKLVCSLHSLNNSVVEERMSFQVRADAINGKIEQLRENHNEELDAIRTSLRESDACRVALVEENARFQETMASSSAEIEALKKELKREIAGRQEADDNRVASENMLFTVQQAHTACSAENNDLKIKFSRLQEQFRQLSETNDALQSDMQSLLRREDAIRKIGSTDKQDLQDKLRAIQEKVRVIEQDRDEEMSKLREALYKAESDCTASRTLNTRTQQINEELERRINDITAELKKRDEQIKNFEDILTSTRADATSKAEKTSKEIVALQKSLADRELTIDALRQDCEGIQSALRERSAAVDAIEASIKKANKENAELQMKLKDAVDESSRDKSTLSSTMESLKQAIVAKDDEIFQLKETIRRECEERTEMLIEISMLKDSLLKCVGGQRSRDFGAGLSQLPPPSSSKQPVGSLQRKYSEHSLVRGNVGAPDTDIQPLLLADANVSDRVSMRQSNSFPSGLRQGDTESSAGGAFNMAQKAKTAVDEDVAWSTQMMKRNTRSQKKSAVSRPPR